MARRRHTTSTFRATAGKGGSSALRQGFDIDRFLRSVKRQGGRLDEHAQELVPTDREVDPDQLLASVASRTALHPTQVYRALADGLGLPFIDMRWIQPDSHLLSLLPMEAWRNHRAFPLAKIGDTIEIAFADINNLQLPLMIEQRHGLQVSRMVAVPHQIDEYLATEMVDAADIQHTLNAISETQLVQFADQLDRGDLSGIGPMFQQVIALAKKLRSSDVHIEPMEKECRVRLRVDGELRECLVLASGLTSALCSYVKVCASLDIAQKRLPQDGRLSVDLGGAKIDLRISTVPTVHGEKMCLRLLDNSSAGRNLKELSFTAKVLNAYRRAIAEPHGLVLVTGPTGSGKTTTLYASLSEIADPARNITTIEDPVEYRLGGINQIQANHKIGLDFPRVLRSVLRQDPDVVLIGEIRDDETAHIAVQAALTGHLVFSTLHTNTAPDAIERLVDMGVPAYLLGEAIAGVLGQRLLRRLCEHCREPYQADERLLDLLRAPRYEHLVFYRPVGCQHCSFSGFQGRIPVHEFMPVDADLRRTIVHERSSAALVEKAWRLGYRPLAFDAMVKALSGFTTAEEVLRVYSSKD